MRATDRTPGRPRDGREARARGAGGRRPGGKAVERVVRRARRASEWGRAKYAWARAVYLWHRPDAFDFRNQAMLPAATLLLCAVPFMLITSALAGRSAVESPTLRLGLSKEAAADVGGLFASSATTSSAVTGLSWVFFVLGGLAATASIQKPYQQMFEVPPRGARDRSRAFGRLLVVVAWVALGTSAGQGFYDGSPVLWWIINVPAFMAFWWFAVRFLLAGRVAWRRPVPCAVATGAFWIGVLTVFHFIFSGMVTGYEDEYGPIGVVITLGAATGMMWHDRGMSFRAALTGLRRPS